MKKVLILSDWYPPAYKAGGPVRSVSNLASKLRNHFEIFILTSDRDLGDEQPFPGISFDTWITKEKNLAVQYVSKSKLTYRNLKELLSSGHFEAVYLNSMYSFYFTILPLWILVRNSYKGKIILAPRGMLQSGALRSRRIKKKLFLSAFKAAGFHRRIVFHATDQQESTDISCAFPKAKGIVSLPNVVGPPCELPPRHVKDGHKLELVYLSVISSKKNLKFLIDILGSVQCAVSLEIYGSIKDKAYWDSFVDEIRSVKNTTMTYHGNTPNEAVVGIINKHDFFILPTLGENFGHAIYEALSAGTPVIISDVTPWRNLEERNAGWDISLDDKEKFVEVLNRCACMGQDEYDQWSRGASDLAKEYYRRNDRTEKYVKMFAE